MSFPSLVQVRMLWELFSTIISASLYSMPSA